MKDPNKSKPVWNAELFERKSRTRCCLGRIFSEDQEVFRHQGSCLHKTALKQIWILLDSSLFSSELKECFALCQLNLQIMTI